jgi:CheY-like chemotaxis protein
MEAAGAGSGEDALSMLRAAAVAGSPFRLPLLDFQLPDMETLALALVIKSDPTINATRLVLVAPLGKGMSSEELKRSGIATCLAQPVKQSRLIGGLINHVDLLVTESPSPKAAEIQSNLARLLWASTGHCLTPESCWPKITLSSYRDERLPQQTGPTFRARSGAGALESRGRQKRRKSWRP